MKRVIELPKLRIEEFTSMVLEGQDIKMYHLYVDDCYVRATCDKQEIYDMITARIKMDMGMY